MLNTSSPASDTSLLQPYMQGFWFKHKIRPLIRPIPVILVHQFHLKIPYHSGEGYSGLRQECSSFHKLAYLIMCVEKGEWAYFPPMQFRGPAEKGLNASLWSLANRSSYKGWDSGRNRSGWNTFGSKKFKGEVWAVCIATPITLCNHVSYDW